MANNRARHTIPAPKRLTRRYVQFLFRRAIQAFKSNEVESARPSGWPNTWLRHDETSKVYFGLAEDVTRDARLSQDVQEYEALLEKLLKGRKSEGKLRRIVFVVNVWHRVGGVLSIAQLVDDLIARGFDVKVVVLNTQGFDESVAVNIEPIFFASRDDFVEHFPDADIVVGTLWSTMYHVMYLFLNRPEFVPAYFVQDFETLFYPESNKVMREHVKRSYGLTPFCFAKTRWICDRVREVGGEITQVPPGLDLDKFSAQGVPSKHGKRAILAMLRPSTPRRGADTLLKVLTKLFSIRTDMEAHFFGSDDKELDSLRIEFPFVNHGAISNDALPDLYSRASLFLECSDFQGFGRTVAEALACETPCVVTRSGGVEDFCTDGENCLMADPGDVDGLVSALVTLLDDDARYASLKARCRESVKHFDRENSAAQTQRFLEDIWKDGRVGERSYTGNV